MQTGNPTGTKTEAATLCPGRLAAESLLHIT